MFDLYGLSHSIIEVIVRTWMERIGGNIYPNEFSIYRKHSVMLSNYLSHSTAYAIVNVLLSRFRSFKMTNTWMSENMSG